MNKVKEFFSNIAGEEHELTDSISEALKDRLTSPFYGYFVISWLLVNWDLVYVAMLSDQDILYSKTGLLRIEYLQSLFRPFPSYVWFFDFLVAPLVFTLIIFWFMPYVTNIFFKKHIQNRIKMEIIRLNALKEKRMAETDLIEAETDLIEAEKEAEKVTPEAVWKKEYLLFKKTDYFKLFGQIKDSIYRHKGKIVISGYYEHSNNSFEVDTGLLAYADSNGLVEIKSDNIALTAKGRYFMKLYSSEIS